MIKSGFITLYRVCTAFNEGKYVDIYMYMCVFVNVYFMNSKSRSFYGEMIFSLDIGTQWDLGA